MRTVLDDHAQPRAPTAAATPQRRPTRAWWLVARKEWLGMLRDARWRLLLATTLVLMAAALVLGLQRAERLAHERGQAQSEDQAVWTAQGAKNPHAAAHFGQYAYKPISPLALAEPGVSAYTGHAVWLEAHRQNDVVFRAARDGTLAARMGQLNFAFVLQTVVPLLALLMGHAAVAGEREQGTLRQLLSLGVDPRHLLAGKLAATGGVLLVLMALAAAGLAIGLLAGSDDLQVGPGTASRLAGLVLGYGLYTGGFLLLAVAVSAALANGRLALVVLLAFWLLNSFLVPRWVGDLVRTADPLPTAQAFREAMAADKKQLFGHDEKHPAFIAFRERVLRQYGVQRVEDLPVSFRGLALREDDQAGYRIFDRHVQRLQAQLDAQDARRSLAGAVFPMLALQPVSMAMAGTDNAHHHDFVRAAEAHRRRIQTATSQDLIDHAANNPAYEAPPDLWRSIPAFSHVPPPAAWAWNNQWRNLGVLAGWCAASALACLLATRRWRRA
jgi:ABC-2 type transport system permease protein